MSVKTTLARVVDVTSDQVLFSCSMEEIARAYCYAAEMENLGLDVKVLAPTLAQTLSNSLGLSPMQQAEYEESVAEETEHHEGSCCFQEAGPPKTSH